MAHLWVRADGEWQVLELAAGVYDLAASPPRPVAATAEEAALGAAAALLVRAGECQGEAWLLVAGREARVAVGGEALVGGARRLADRDALRVGGGEELFFSSERRARVEPHPAGMRPLFCPRCKQAIAADALTVRCPACGAWHHESAELPCWTYAPACALCPQPTALDAGWRWTPEDP
jgi:hypothetical protein